MSGGGGLYDVSDANRFDHKLHNMFDIVPQFINFLGSQLSKPEGFNGHTMSPSFH